MAETTCSQAGEGAGVLYHAIFTTNVLCFFDAYGLVQMTRLCKYFRDLLNDQNLLKWITTSQTRAAHSFNCIEHLRIYELLHDFRNKVYFFWGSLDIQAEGQKVIKFVSKVCAVHPRLQVRVEGHVGIESPDNISMEYSQKRAEAVAQGIRCMMPPGKSPPKIHFTGYGKSRPMVTACGPLNTTSRHNRRVEIYLVDSLCEDVEFPTRQKIPAFTKDEIQDAIEKSYESFRSTRTQINLFVTWLQQCNNFRAINLIQAIRGQRQRFNEFFHVVLLAAAQEWQGGRFALEENTNHAVYQYLDDRVNEIRAEMVNNSQHDHEEPP